MPNFTWDLGPAALSFPKDPLLLVVGLVAALMLIFGLVKKQTDLAVFGLFMGALLAFASNFLPDPVQIRYYSLLFVGVFLGGYALFNWQVQRGGGDEETAGDFIVYGVLGVLVGSRLGHVLFYDLDKAIEDPLWVLQIWTGGLASHGAVIGLAIAVWLFTKRRGVSFLEGTDRFAFSAAWGATLVRLGNFFNSEIVGRVVPDQSWGVRFPLYDQGEAPLRYPTQIFEMGLGLFVLFSLWVVDRAFGKEKRPRGLLISTYFVLYFTGRFTVEYWKEFQTVIDETTPFTMGQYLSMPGIVLGIVGLIWSLKRREPAGWTTNKVASRSASGDQEVETGDEDDAPAPLPKLYDPDVDEELHGDAQVSAPDDEAAPPSASPSSSSSPEPGASEADKEK